MLNRLIDRTWRSRVGVIAAALCLCVVSTHARHYGSLDNPCPYPDPSVAAMVDVDATRYQPGDLVNVTARGFAPGCQLTVRLTGPSGAVGDSVFTTDEQGKFTASFTLQAAKGTYKVGVVLGDDTDYWTFVQFTSGPFLETDMPDYAPGNPVTFSGGNWLPGDFVTIVLHEIDGPGDHGDVTVYAVADAAGKITNRDFATDAQDRGVHFIATATGVNPGDVAQVEFKDAFAVNNRVTAGNWSSDSTWSVTRLGAISTTSGSKNVTGNGAAGQDFTVDLAPGNVITQSGNPEGTVIGTVDTITDATHLVLLANAPSTLANVAYKARRVPATVAPFDDVTINRQPGSSTITLDVNASANTLTINANGTAGGGGSATLTYGGTQTLSVTGLLSVIGGAGTNGGAASLNINAGSASAGSLTTQFDTITLTSGTLDIDVDALLYSGGAGTSTLTVGAGSFLVGGNLTIQGGGNGANTATLSIATGTVTVTGNVVSGGGAANTPRITFSNAGTLYIGGNLGAGLSLTNSATGAGSTIDFTGTGASTIAAYTFQNLTINKSGGAGFPAILAGNVIVNGSLSVNTGVLDEGASFSLTPNTGMSIAAGATYRNVGTGDLTLGGDLSNAGAVIINGTTNACGEANPIQLRSTVALTQRAWTGGGTFDLQDVDVKDQAGTALITAWSSTVPVSPNNGANWTINAACGSGTSTTTPTSTVNPSPFGAGITLSSTVTIAAPVGGSPIAGTVAFKEQPANTNVAGCSTVALVAGVANCVPTTSLSVGTHTINAVYTGTVDFPGSTSPGSLSQEVTANPTAGPSCTLTVDKNGASGVFPTIQEAVNQLPNPGPCTINVKAGTYNESVTITSPHNNSSATLESQRIVIQRDPSAAVGSVIVDASGANTFLFSGNPGANFITIKGFDLTGASSSAIATSTNTNTNLTFDSNQIYDNAPTDPTVAGGIDLSANTVVNIVIVNNLIRNNGRDGIGIGAASVASIYIVNNTIFANHFNGIAHAGVTPTFVVNNLIVGNGTASGTTGGRFGLQQTSGATPANVRLVNNIFYNNSGGEFSVPTSFLDSAGTDSGNLTTTGVGFTSGSITASFASGTNTITKTVGTSFLTSGFAIGDTITTNNGSNPGPFTITSVSAGAITVAQALTTVGSAAGVIVSDITGVAGCTFADCLPGHANNEIFVDTAANNFHLKTAAPISPAIDKGVNNYVSGSERVPTVDFEGSSRPADGDGVLGAQVDAGYDEAGPAITDHTVTFDGNGATAGSMSPQTASAPTALTTNAFTRTGYSFAGWNTVAGGGGTAYGDGVSYPFTADATLYAQWTAVSQTLTFESNGGTAVTAITQDFGTAVSAPPNPTRSGYTFAGWFTDDGTFLNAYSFSTMGLSTTIYAQWTAVSQTLTFESNGGTAVTAITQDFGSSVSAPAAPTRTGYTFGGWFTDDGTFLAAYTFPHTMGLSTTIYAKWTAVSQTLTFESNGGTAVTAITQDFDTSVSAPANPTRTGYTFGGWFTDDGTFLAAYTFPHTMGLSTTIYAKWTAVSQTLTFESNGGTAVTAITQDFGTAVSAPPNPTRSGYTFAGWFTDDGTFLNAYSFSTMGLSTTIYAKWTAVSQTLTFESNGGTAVTAITQDYGTAVSAPPNPTRSGYTFAGWFTDDGTFLNAYSFSTMGLSTTIYAKWTAVSQTLTFESNGGTAVTAITQDFGTAVSAPPNPTRSGYTFAGWFTDDGTFLNAYSFSTMGLSTTIYAKWTAVSQTLTFESNGGTAVTAITQDFGTAVSAPPNPTRSGYTFAGWYTDDGTFLNAYSFSTMGLSTTIYAKWTAVSQTLTFESNGGTAVTAITQDFGTAVSAPPNPTRSGYTFAGWFTDDGTFLNAYSFSTMGLSTTIYAKWTADGQTLTFESNGGTAVTAITQDFGSSVSAPANPTRTGYTFGGWFTDDGTFLAAYIFPHTMGLSTTIYAKWTAVSQTLTFESNGGTAVTAITQDFGTAVSAPPNPTRSGYTFAGWYTDDGTFLNAYSFSTMGLSTTIYAKWTAVSQTLTFESNGGSAVTAITQDFGSSVSAPAAPTRTGYTFGGWFTDDGTFLAAYTFPHTMGLSTTIYAKWTAVSQTLTFESNGGSAVGPITQDFGSSVSAPADPTRTGYTFGGWFTDNGTFLAAYTFPHTMGLSTTIYAKWTVNSYDVSYDGNGSTGGTAPATQNANYNTSVTLAGAGTLVKTGYTFDGWNTQANGGGTSYAGGASFTIPAAATTLYAKWTLTQSKGSLKVTKVVTGVPGGGFFMASFTVHVECTAGGPYADKVLTYPFPGNVTYTDIPAGATCTVTEITKSAPPGGYLWGPEVITPTTSLPIPAGGTAYVTVTNPMAPAPAPPTPGLGITKTANKTTVTFGESVTYAYVVKNTGGVTLTDVVVVDDNGTPSFAGDDVTVGTIASLAPGASQTFTRTLVPPAPVCGKDYGGHIGTCGQLLTEHRSDGTTKFTYLQAKDGRDGYSGSGGWSGKRSYAQQTQFRVWNKNGTYTDVNTTPGAGDGSKYFNSFSFVVNKSSIADANGTVKLPGIFHKNGWNRDWHLDWDKLYGDPTRQKYWDTVARSWDKYTDRHPCSADVTNTAKVTAKAGATTLTASDTETVTVK